MKYAFLLLAALLPVPLAQAKDAEGVMNHVALPETLQPDKAYLLFDSSRAKSGIMQITHVLMRVPDQTEIDAYRAAKKAAYEKELPKLTKRAKGEVVPTLDEYSFSWSGVQNTFALDLGKPLGDGSTYLVEVPTGTYVLYGISVGSRGLAVCNCLGTVKFDAAGGTITRIGALYADKVHKDSPFEQLEDNLGEKMFSYSFILGQALVPASESDPLPAGIENLPSVVAEFQPVGMFAEPGAASINRLAPIPGVLEYDRGRVVLPDEETK